MQDRQGNQNDQLYNPKQTLMYGLVGMNIMAGGHRLIHYRLGSPGTRAIDRYTWLSAAIANPFFVAAWPPIGPFQHRNAYLMWLGLLAMAFIHSSAAFWNPAIRHSQEIGRAIFGWLEVPVSLLAAYFACAFCGPGAGFYLVAALAANVIQIETIKARYRRMVALQTDAEIEAGTFQSYRQ